MYMEYKKVSVHGVQGMYMYMEYGKCTWSKGLYRNFGFFRSRNFRFTTFRVKVFSFFLTPNENFFQRKNILRNKFLLFDHHTKIFLQRNKRKLRYKLMCGVQAFYALWHGLTLTMMMICMTSLSHYNHTSTQAYIWYPYAILFQFI